MKHDLEDLKKTAAQNIIRYETIALSSVMAQAIVDYMECFGWTDDDMASKCGISKAMWEAILEGESILTIEHMAKISHGLQCRFGLSVENIMPEGNIHPMFQEVLNGFYPEGKDK